MYRAFIVGLLSASIVMGQAVPTDKEAIAFKVEQKKELTDEIKQLQKQLADLQNADLPTIKKMMETTAPADDRLALVHGGSAFKDPGALIGMKLDDAAKALGGKYSLQQADSDGAIYKLSNDHVEKTSSSTTVYMVTVDKDKKIMQFDIEHEDVPRTAPR